MQFCDIIAVYFENHTEFLNCVDSMQSFSF